MQSHKVTQNEIAKECISGEQEKNPRRITKWSRDKQSTQWSIQNNDSKDDPESWKNNAGMDWEDIRNV